MTRYHKSLGVFLVTLFGLWGCARGPATSGSSAANDKIKALESKSAKLEDDLKASVSAKDQLRKKLSDAQEVHSQLQQEMDRLKVVVKERDELRALLKTRTTERDLVQSKYENFLKDLKELAVRAEASLPGSKPATTGIAQDEHASLKPAAVGVVSSEQSDPTVQAGGS